MIPFSLLLLLGFFALSAAHIGSSKVVSGDKLERIHDGDFVYECGCKKIKKVEAQIPLFYDEKFVSRPEIPLQHIGSPRYVETVYPSYYTGYGGIHRPKFPFIDTSDVGYGSFGPVGGYYYDVPNYYTPKGDYFYGYNENVPDYAYLGYYYVQPKDFVVIRPKFINTGTQSKLVKPQLPTKRPRKQKEKIPIKKSEKYRIPYEISRPKSTKPQEHGIVGEKISTNVGIPKKKGTKLEYKDASKATGGVRNDEKITVGNKKKSGGKWQWQAEDNEGGKGYGKGSSQKVPNKKKSGGKWKWIEEEDEGVKGKKGYGKASGHKKVAKSHKNGPEGGGGKFKQEENKGHPNGHSRTGGHGKVGHEEHVARPKGHSKTGGRGKVEHEHGKLKPHSEKVEHGKHKGHPIGYSETGGYGRTEHGKHEGRPKGHSKTGGQGKVEHEHGRQKGHPKTGHGKLEQGYQKQGGGKGGSSWEWSSEGGPDKSSGKKKQAMTTKGGAKGQENYGEVEGPWDVVKASQEKWTWDSDEDDEEELEKLRRKKKKKGQWKFIPGPIEEMKYNEYIDKNKPSGEGGDGNLKSWEWSSSSADEKDALKTSRKSDKHGKMSWSSKD